MIKTAAVLPTPVKDWVDFAIILALLLFTAGVGFWREQHVASTLDALKGELAQEGQKLKALQRQTMLAKTLVPGDLVRIQLGNVVPADVKLLKFEYPDVDQSAATADSLLASKRAGDCAHAGSIVKKGEMAAEVTSTGLPTFFGRTALLERTGAKPHLGEVDDRSGDLLAILAVFLDPLVLNTYQQVSFIAFDPRTEATIKDSKGNEFKISKGMPPVIFELAGITGEDLVKAQRVVGDYAAKGYRTLAAARTDESGKWVTLGILPMFDPGSKETVARAAE